MDQLEKYSEIVKHIYQKKGSDVLIGGEVIKPDFLSVLRDQAYYLSTSQLYEIYIATLRNEAMELSLIQSKDWDEVNFAKALWHAAFVLENMVKDLAVR